MTCWLLETDDRRQTLVNAITFQLSYCWNDHDGINRKTWTNVTSRFRFFNIYDCIQHSTNNITPSSMQHPRRCSVFVVDGDDGVDLDRDEADERREAGLEGERGEGAEAEDGHQRVQDQAL